MSRRSEQASGRENALAALEEHLMAALRGQGRVVGVRGEPGTGRSELTLAFLRGCRERGLAICGVDCLAHGHSAAFVPGRELLRALLGVSERDLGDVARARIESALVPLDPGIEGELPLLGRFLGLEDPDENAPEAGDQRAPLLALVSRIVRAMAGGAPQVLLVDDVDHIDPASAELISAIAEAADGSRTLLVTTAAPDHRAGWMDKPCFRGIDLAGDSAAADLAARVAELADDERLVLGIGAEIGMHFSLPMVQRCCDLSGERLAAALYALQNSGLVRPRSRTPEAGFAISGARVRDSALTALDPVERAGAHRRIALAIEDLDFERLDERAPLIAHHWERAGEPEAAARWHRHAARCIAPWAPELAQRHARKAEAAG